MSARKVRERPVRRTYPSGAIGWIARVSENGRRRSLGTHPRRSDAQAAIDDFYDRGQWTKPSTLGAYAETWSTRHPRSERTNRTNDGRVRRVLDVRISGRDLGDWQLNELRRKHALELVAALLTEQGRSTTGAAGILRTLSALAEDAITDELCEVNPFRGVRIRSNDPRATKQPRVPRTFTFEQMHRFASFAGPHEPAIRLLSDCGLRLGEMLGLERSDFDGAYVHVRGTVWEARFIPGDQPTKRHVRSVPVPPSTAELLRAIPARLDTPLMFPTLRGKIWRQDNWRHKLWTPTKLASGLDCTPHEFRHSYLSELQAAGVDSADVAQVAGHSVETLHGRYTHALGRSDNLIRGVVG